MLTERHIRVKNVNNNNKTEARRTYRLNITNSNSSTFTILVVPCMNSIYIQKSWDMFCYFKTPKMEFLLPQSLHSVMMPTTSQNPIIKDHREHHSKIKISSRIMADITQNITLMMTGTTKWRDNTHIYWTFGHNIHTHKKVDSFCSSWTLTTKEKEEFRQLLLTDTMV